MYLYPLITFSTDGMTLMAGLKLLQVSKYLLTKCYIKKKLLLIRNHSRDFISFPVPGCFTFNVHAYLLHSSILSEVGAKPFCLNQVTTAPSSVTGVGICHLGQPGSPESRHLHSSRAVLSQDGSHGKCNHSLSLGFIKFM